MSIMVGVGRGAQAGILIRDAEALEILGRVDTLLVDKTGTLTAGKPELVTVAAAAGFDEMGMLRDAAALEKNSEHPLAGAIVSGARKRDAGMGRRGDGETEKGRRQERKTDAEFARHGEPLGRSVTEFKSLTGKGIMGRIGGRMVALGNLALMDDLDVDVGGLAGRAEELRADGQTVMLVAIDGKAAGILGVADPIKPTTVEAVKLLREDGVEIVMVTGDSKTTALAVARKLGIARVEAEVLPQEKIEAVLALQREGRRVAMAGDGINDAPALAQADVGIAMGTGADVAMAGAGVTLIHGDLRGIAKARRLSRATMRNIKQNLFFAFVYNSLGIPVAAGILYPIAGIVLSPMIAAAAMTFSSVSVIGNALRLRRIQL
jgi:P-type Cu+ transporter